MKEKVLRVAIALVVLCALVLAVVYFTGRGPFAPAPEPTPLEVSFTDTVSPNEEYNLTWQTPDTRWTVRLRYPYPTSSLAPSIRWEDAVEVVAWNEGWSFTNWTFSTTEREITLLKGPIKVIQLSEEQFALVFPRPGEELEVGMVDGEAFLLEVRGLGNAWIPRYRFSFDGEPTIQEAWEFFSKE